MYKAPKGTEERTASLYEDIHGFADNSYTIGIYLRTLGIDREYFKGKRTLDCGFGGTAWGAELFASGGAALVAGIDLNAKWVELAKQRLAKFNVPLDLRKGNVLDLPFEDNSFDYVHCFGVLHHTRDWKRGVAEMVRVAKPDGTIFLMVYARYAPVGRMIQKTYRMMGKIIPYKFMVWFVNKTGLLRSPEVSLLDGMYVPIELHLDREEIRSYLGSLNLKNITFFSSDKWKKRWLYRLIFGKTINHNVWAVKPGM